MSGLNPCSAAGLEEFCQALVFEASNHSLNVPCNVSGVKAHNAEHSGDLGVATKEPRKGRPAAIGRILLRLVMGQEHNTLTLAESAGTVLCRMNKKHSSLHAWVLVKHGKTHTRRNTGMSR